MGRSYLTPRVVRVSGTPRQMGWEHGEQLKPLIRRHMEYTKAGYHRIGLTGARLEKVLRLNLSALQKSLPERVEELEGMAKGANVELYELFASHFYHEISCAQRDSMPYEELNVSAGACTGFAAAGSSVSDGPLLAMNTDSGCESMRFRVTIVAEPKTGYRYVSHSRATDNGGYGLNEKGLCIVAPTVISRDCIDAFAESKVSGVYDRAITRTVLSECANVDEALEYCTMKPGGYQGINILMADASGDIAKVERSYDSTNIIHPTGSKFFLAGTNHYGSDVMKSLGPTTYDNSYRRYSRITTLLDENDGKMNLRTFQNFARDHANGPGNLSICRHGDEMCTNCSLIAEPEEKKLWLLSGTPCENEYALHTISR